MAEHSGFFTALKTDGVYDRQYTAEDYCDNLAVVIGSGVRRSNLDDLDVTYNDGKILVSPGRAWIEGHYYYNDTSLTLAEVSFPSAGMRRDLVILQLDKSRAARRIALVYRKGEEGANPSRPQIIRSGDVYELALAEIVTRPNASVTVNDWRPDEEYCGWVYSTAGNTDFFTSLDKTFYKWFEKTKNDLSSVTLFKRYQYKEILKTAAKELTFDIPQYDEETCFAEVYINGLFSIRYSLSGSTVTFFDELIAGTLVTVNVYKSIDGTGIMSVSDEITQLQNDVAGVKSECSTLGDELASAEARIDGAAGDVDSKIAKHNADAAAHSALWEQFVPASRTINGKVLNDDVTLSAEDLGALMGSGTQSFGSNSEMTEDSFNNWLDERLNRMDGNTTMCIRFEVYPAISGNRYFGFLFKKDYDYASLLGFSYNTELILKVKYGGTWENTRRLTFS